LPKKNGILQAKPDGSIRWTAWMEKLITHPLRRHDGATFAPESGLDVNGELFREYYRRSYGDRIPALLCLLKWHGLAALDILLSEMPPALSGKRVDEEFLKIVLNIHHERLVDALLPYLHLLAVRQTLHKQAERWPLWVMQRLLALNPHRAQAGATLLLELLAAHPDWLPPLREACDDPTAKTLARLLETERAVEAPIEALPEILRLPPWRERREAPQVPPPSPFTFAPLREPGRIHWENDASAPPKSDRVPAGESSESSESSDFETFDRRFDGHRHALPEDVRESSRSWPLAYKALHALGVRADALQRIAEGGVVGDDDVGARPAYFPERHLALLVLPPELARRLLARVPVLEMVDGDGLGVDAFPLRRLFERFGDVLLAAIAREMGHRPNHRPPRFVSFVESDLFAVPLAKMLVANRWARQTVRQWLARFPAAAARGLLPAALGTDAAFAAPARHALRWLAANGHRAVLARVAADHGALVTQALAALLAIAPEDILPAKLPVPPTNLFLPGLPRLRLTNGDWAVPASALPDVLMLLMLSRADEPYAGLAAVQEAVSPESFARFGQALFKWWQDNGAPPKERWMFEAQGLLGNDETARQLALALRQWRAALNRVRAYDAMNMLARIGSDLALMHLHALSTQTRFNDLIGRADDLLRDVAEQRGLSLEELADRTVPDLGFDARGVLTLDFGPRQFELRLSRLLAPCLRDSDGKALKDLPKPGVRDDPVCAKEAVARFKDLKKQLKSIAANQIRRLEGAMCARRRWERAAFAGLFVAHPVRRPLSQALIWGVYDADGALRASCRVAEDLSLADEQDNEYLLPDDALLGILHPLEVPCEWAASWQQRLAEYRILPPFPQLGRQVYALSDAEAAGGELPAWVGRSVSTGALLGLEQRGWRRAVGDGGMVDGFFKDLPGGSVILCLEEGWFVGAPAASAEMQKVAEVRLHGIDGWSRLDGIACSEVLRDLQLMIGG